MAPTYTLEHRVTLDWKRLTADQKVAFREARDKLFEDRATGKGFRPSLRVKGVQGTRGIFEMTWAPDGRATFEYGSEQREGGPHIVWRRIGTHDISGRP